MEVYKSCGLRRITVKSHRCFFSHLNVSQRYLYKRSADTRSMKQFSPEPKSRFVKVRCSKCKNEQIIYGKPATIIDCLVCQKPLAEPSGGKGKIKARILEVLS